MKTIASKLPLESKKAGTKQVARALQTFLRNSYRTHTALSSLADRKANILVKFNSIIISVLIVFFRNIIEMNPSATVSVLLFLITTLLSLVFATLAARPKLTKHKRSPSNINVLKEDVFFFGNFIHLSLPDYEKAFAAMAQDSSCIYGNMARDLYYLGRILDKKFKYLKWSYNTFLAGLIFTVITFLLIFFDKYLIW